jgi:KaiC/GvpD/RAD55 family RecA-like ATPase
MGSGNLSIEDVETRLEGDTPLIELDISNNSGEVFYRFLKLYSGQTRIETRLIEVNPGESTSEVFELPETDTRITLTEEDDERGVIFSAEVQDSDFSPGIADNLHNLEERLKKPVSDLFHSEEPDKPVEKEETEEKKTKEQDSEEEDDSGEDEPEIRPDDIPDRVSTGIINLDSKMNGGFVKGTMNLVTGKTGTGKTAFCSNFIKEGAENGEPGVYVTTEEREEDIHEDIESMFGWDFRELEEQDKVRLLSIKPIFPSSEIENLNRLVRSYISDLLDQVRDAIDEIDADRVIIDSVSLVQMFIKDEYMARVALSSLLNNLREAGVTAILTGTVPETSEGLSKAGIVEFLVDTVILLEFVPVAEEHKRTLTIRKMRRTDHETEIFPFEISPDGIRIFEPHR